MRLLGSGVVLTSEQGDVMQDPSIKTVKGFLTRLQLLPFTQQQRVLRHFISKIKQRDNAMALQLESRTVKVVRERVVFQNPRNAAEQVTLQEIECDCTCTMHAPCVHYTCSFTCTVAHPHPHAQVTVQEIECDHTCTWAAALALAGNQVGMRGFWMSPVDRTRTPFLVQVLP